MSFGFEEGTTSFLLVPKAYTCAAEQLSSFYFEWSNSMESKSKNAQENAKDIYNHIQLDLHRMGECPHACTGMNYQWHRLDEFLDQKHFNEEEKIKIFKAFLDCLALRSRMVIIGTENKTNNQVIKERNESYKLIRKYIKQIKRHAKASGLRGLDNTYEHFEQKIECAIVETQQRYEKKEVLKPKHRKKSELHAARLIIDFCKQKEIEPIPLEIIAHLIESLFGLPIDSLDPDNLARDYRRIKSEQKK